MRRGRSSPRSSLRAATSRRSDSAPSRSGRQRLRAVFRQYDPHSTTYTSDRPLPSAVPSAPASSGCAVTSPPAIARRSSSRPRTGGHVSSSGRSPLGSAGEPAARGESSWVPESRHSAAYRSSDCSGAPASDGTPDERSVSCSRFAAARIASTTVSRTPVPSSARAETTSVPGGAPRALSTSTGDRAPGASCLFAWITSGMGWPRSAASAARTASSCAKAARASTTPSGVLSQTKTTTSAERIRWRRRASNRACPGTVTSWQRTE